MSFIPNKQEYRPILIKGRDHNVSRNVLIHKEYLGHWQALESTQHTNFYRGNTYRFIYKIGGIADQRDHNKHTINNSEVELSYCFDELGDVYICSLSFVQKAHASRQDASAYTVEFKWDEEESEYSWMTDKYSSQKLELTSACP